MPYWMRVKTVHRRQNEGLGDAILVRQSLRYDGPGPIAWRPPPFPPALETVLLLSSLTVPDRQALRYYIFAKMF
jgi:hypothetical protein